MASLTDAAVQEIRLRRAAGMKQIVLAEQFGISTGQVSMIVNNRSWRLDPFAPTQPKRPRLSDADVENIRTRWSRKEATGKALAAEFGISTANVSLIVNGKRH